MIVRLELGPGAVGLPLDSVCSPAKNELKPGQRQPLPQKTAGVKRQALTPGPGLQRIIVNAEFDRVPRRSDIARTFEWGSPLADRSYLVGAVGSAALTAPVRRLRPSGRSTDNQPESGQRHPFWVCRGASGNPVSQAALALARRLELSRFTLLGRLSAPERSDVDIAGGKR